MQETAAEARTEVCHRCLQPVPRQATRCPHCGDPLHRAANLRLLLGLLAAAIMLLALFFMVLRLTHSSAPAAPDSDDQTQQQNRPADLAPAEPQQKPALGQ